VQKTSSLPAVWLAVTLYVPLTRSRSAKTFRSFVTFGAMTALQ
jgi:hypothetical protein